MHTKNDLKGMRASQLRRVVTLCGAALDRAGNDYGAHGGLEAFAIKMAGSTAPRDVALCALDQVAMIGGQKVAIDPSRETLAWGGFLSGEARWAPGQGHQIAGQILATVREAADMAACWIHPERIAFGRTMAARMAARVRGMTAWNHTPEELGQIVRGRRNGFGLRITFVDGSAAFVPTGTAEVRVAG